MKKNKTIYQSIRKTIAPPTKVFKNHREELLLESIEKDYEDLLCDFCGRIMHRNIGIYIDDDFCYVCSNQPEEKY